MSDVRIFIDGIEHPVDKRLFAEMMYASEAQSDQWFYNNTCEGNSRLADKWMSISEKAHLLRAYVFESIEKEENY